MSDFVRVGETNLIAVRVNNTVNSEIPPDGGKTDFVQFGGIYRDVTFLALKSPFFTFNWQARDAGVRVKTAPMSNDSDGDWVVSSQTNVANFERNVVSFKLVYSVFTLRVDGNNFFHFHFFFSLDVDVPFA